MGRSPSMCRKRRGRMPIFDSVTIVVIGKCCSRLCQLSNSWLRAYKSSGWATEYASCTVRCAESQAYSMVDTGIEAMSTVSSGVSWLWSVVTRFPSGKHTVNLNTVSLTQDDRRVNILGPCSCVKRRRFPTGNSALVDTMFWFSILSTLASKYVSFLVPRFGSFLDNEKWQCRMVAFSLELKARQNVVKEENPVLIASSGFFWLECSIFTWWDLFFQQIID